MKIAYLGPEGKGYTYSMTRQLFSNEELLPLLPIRRVVMAVENGQVDFGVIPFENAKEGKVWEGLDTLAVCKKTKIVQESFLPIVHCLGALNSHGEIKKIMSKDTAIAQCGEYLYSTYPDVQTIATSSTGEAVDIVVNLNLTDTAAIASEETLRPRLEVLARDISPNNKTRFGIISRDPTPPTEDDKTLIALYPPTDSPGTLVQMLHCFADRGLNLEGISERPLMPRGYYFYSEINGHEDDKLVREALQAARFVKVIGSYRNSYWKGKEETK